MTRLPAEQPSAGFSCLCGRVQGHLSPVSSRTGTHAICHCGDCRRALTVLSQPDPGADGIDLFQTTPDCVYFTQGQELLGLIRLSPKGMLRWHATCCNAPLFNTLASPKLALATLHVARMADPSVIGPVRAHGFIPQQGKPPRHKGVAIMVTQLATRMIAARLSGRWRQTPFFDADSGQPVVEAMIAPRSQGKR